MNEKLTFPLFLISKKILTATLFLGFIFSDDSWKVYDESDLAYIHITIDPEDLVMKPLTLSVLEYVAIPREVQQKNHLRLTLIILLKGAISII